MINGLASGSSSEDQGAAVTPGMEEQEENGHQLTRGRLQWFLMLDYRLKLFDSCVNLDVDMGTLYADISSHSS